MIARVLLSLVCLLALTACEDMGSDPLASELDGTWVNVDDGTVRGYVFNGELQNFELFVYDDGTQPIVSRRGTYTISKGHLVTVVEDALDPAAEGQEFAQDISAFSGARFTLEDLPPSSASRTYVRADALP